MSTEQLPLLTGSFCSVALTWRPRLKFLTNIALAAVVATASVLLWPPDRLNWRPLGLVQNFERLGYDAMFAARGPELDRIDPRIVVVGFEQQSEQSLGANWPPPRAVHAAVIDRLVRDGASLIVYDVLFSGPSPHGANDDRALDAALIRSKGEVVLSMRINRSIVGSTQSKNIEAPYSDDSLGIDFEGHAATGFAEIPQDEDDAVRWLMPALAFQGQWTPSLASAAYLRLKGLSDSDIDVLPSAVRIGNLRVPRSGPTGTDVQDHTSVPNALLNFPGGLDSFPSVPFEQVALGQFRPGLFKGKIVLVGVTGPQITKELQEQYVTAYSHLHPEQSGSVFQSRIPGVVLQAQNLNTLLSQTFLTALPTGQLWILVFFFALLGTTAARQYINWRGPVALILVCTAYVGICYALFNFEHIHAPWVLPLALMFLSASAVAWLERGALRRKWAGYVSPEVLEVILREGGGEAQHFDATVIFGDIRGFTALTAKHNAQRVMRLLNLHFEKMTEILQKDNGTIDKFLGDGMIALFGCPVPQKDAAIRAVRSSWDMCQASKVAVVDAGEEFVLESGFGVTSGPFVAGHVGSRRHHNFTIIGEVVNIASRLQGVTGGADLVIDEATYQQVRLHVTVEPLGAIDLKGQPEPLPAYKVTSWSNSPREDVSNTLQ